VAFLGRFIRLILLFNLGYQIFLFLLKATIIAYFFFPLREFVFDIMLNFLFKLFY
jgi:hypothetical protein